VSVGELRALVRLDCARNAFSRTSTIGWIERVRTLPELRPPPPLGGQPFLPPRALVGRGVDEVRAFFAKLEAEQSTAAAAREAAAAQRTAAAAARRSAAAARSSRTRPRRWAEEPGAPPPPAPPARPPPAAPPPAAPPRSVPPPSASGAAATETEGPGGALTIRASDLQIGRPIAEGAFAEGM
jgi:hypothetical protein